MTATERPTARLQLMLTHPRGGNDTEPRTSMRITDYASNVILAELELTPAQFVDLMSNTNVDVDAVVPSPTETDRLFRERTIDSRIVPTELGSKAGYKEGGEAKERIESWATEIMFNEDWDTYNVVTSSQRFYVTFLRWAPRA